MLTNFEKKVAEFIEANKLFSSADRVLLAISGGADSTALLHLMCALKADGVLSNELICAHINHQLRGPDAKLDEDFVIAQAAKLGLPVITRRVDVREFANSNKLSIETAARQLRIENLLDIAKGNNCNWIATGHQKNDNAETVLGRLLRGTGFRGLGGIWAVRNFDAAPAQTQKNVFGGPKSIRFARPLLCVRRDEIIEYLTKRKLSWQTDRTNVDFKYRRNFIRLALLPALQQKCNGSIIEQLFQLAGCAQRFYKIVCDSADKVWDRAHKRVFLRLASPPILQFNAKWQPWPGTPQGGNPQLAEKFEIPQPTARADRLKLHLEIFLAQPKPVKVELVRRALVTLGSGEKDLTQGHFNRILQLAGQNISGKKIELPNGFVVWREYDSLVFAHTKKMDARYSSLVSHPSAFAGTGLPLHQQGSLVQIPGQTRFCDYLIEATILEAKTKRFEQFRSTKSKFIEWFDMAKLSLPLVVRFRQTGDRFWPLGLAGQTKVGKFLTAAKVPQQLRGKLLIIADSEKIIWVWPIRMSQQVKIGGETQKVLQLRITEVNATH